jgi:hypothetical protein
MNKIKEELLIKLSNFGWYMPPNMKLLELLELLDSIRNNDFEKKEHIIISYFKENIVNIENDLLAKNINILKLLREAFLAHREGMYYSSTILFLSQSDGLCNANFFTNLKKRNNYLEDKKSPYFVNSVLLITSSIDKDSRQQNIKFKSKLNRHQIMHGLDNEFGTEINSLKSLSFLLFISCFVDRYKD